jgi:hypothetical protein
MITSSIPILRSLFVRRKPSTSTYEMQNGYPTRNKSYGMNSNLKSQITSRGYPGPESTSEENILPVSSKAVLKSTSYSVAYEVDQKSEV